MGSLLNVETSFGEDMPEHQATASEMIENRINELGDWRGRVLGEARRLIRQADPQVVEEWKWPKVTNPGTPVWSDAGIICTGEVYKQIVKLTFAKGASLKDPSKLFNSSLDGNVRRAIDFKQGDKIPKAALTALVKEAIALNRAKAKR